MMNSIRRRCLQYLFCILVPLTAGAQDNDRKIHSTGVGFSFSSGQSLFFIRETNPFRTNHTYLAAGFHIEEEGIGLTVYDYRFDRYERFGTQIYYLEFGWGWRRLWFRESLAGGFFPHTGVEGGVSGHISQFGKLRNFFRETSLCWVPYLQAGAGASIYTGVAIYRVEMGYLTTLSYLPKTVFPEYHGAYMKIVISSGKKPR